MSKPAGGPNAAAN